jgi:hypothetical protein
MTITLLQPYATYTNGSTVALDNATETALVAQGRAKFVLNSGSAFQPLTAVEQQALKSSAYSVGPTFAPKTATYGGIIDAVNAATANGGGTVQLLPVMYDISTSGLALPLRNGVVYQGSGYNMTAGRILTGGTIIKQSATVDAFAMEADVIASTFNGLYAGSVTRTGVKSLAVDGGRYGVRAGGLYRGTRSICGLFYADFSDLYFKLPAAWGMYLDNFNLSKARDIICSIGSSAQGNFWFGGSSSTTYYNGGNSRIDNILCEGGGPLQRNIVFNAAQGCAYNDLVVTGAQANSGGVKITVAATMANGSANITVPDGTLFPLDMPVTVDATVNGFGQRITYFVISQIGNVIQLSDFMQGIAKTATGNTAVNLVRYGYAPLEIVGYGGFNASQIQSSCFYGIDAEGIGTNMIEVQNASADLQINFIFSGQDVGQASSLCVRNSQGSFHCIEGITTDFDGTAATNFLSRYSGKATGVNVNSGPQGFFRDLTGTFGLTLGSGSSVVGMAGVNSPGQQFVYPFVPIGQRTQVSTATTLALYGAYQGCLAFTGTANAVWTLDQVGFGVGGTANTYTGSPLEVANCSTTVGVTLTINCFTGQTFNRQAAKTSIVLALGQAVSLRAQYDGTSGFWQVLGSNGITV